MRTCACFSNCSPAPATVTITNTTNNYQIGANQIGWEQELFSSFTPANPTSVTDPDTGAVLTAACYVTIASTPVSRKSVEVNLGGSIGQRPLIAYDGSQTTGFDYFVIGDKVYLNFTPDGTLFISYVGAPLTAVDGALVSGYMTEIAIADVDTYLADPEWVVADGVTPYSVIAYADLYASLVANGQGTVVEVGETTESYAANSPEQTPGALVTEGFVVPSGAFVVRYLSPYTRSPLPDPTPLFRSRSSKHRVVIRK